MKKFIFFIAIFVFLALKSNVVASSNDLVAGSAASLKSSVETAPDQRVDVLRKYLMTKNPQMTNHAQDFIKAADENALDWKLVVSIAGLESSFCRFIPSNSFNCWGWGIPTGAKSGIGFKNYQEGIHTVSKGLRNKYVNKGLLTVEQIGSVYAASPTWAFRVKSFMNEIENFKPDKSQLQFYL